MTQARAATQADFGWRGGRVRAADGTSIAYLTAGEGPLTVLVHGGISEAAHLAAVAQQLATTHRVVVIDRRNSGNSGWAEEVGVDIEARDVLAVLDEVGPADLLYGQSYGAAVALHAALADPDRVSRLVLYEPPLAVGGPVIDEQTLHRWAELVAAGDYAAVMSEFYLPPISSLGAISDEEHAMVRALPDYHVKWADLVGLAPVVVPGLRSVNALDDASRYQAINAPTLLLLGTESLEHPFQDTTRALAEAIPNASVTMLQGQRHSAAAFTPHLVVDAIRSFAAGTAESLRGG